MLDPAKFSVKFFILYHCYILNSSSTREAFKAMTPREMHVTIRDRTRVEHRLALSSNALAAAWKRLQLLAAAVGDQVQVLTEEQLSKERELLVGLIDRLGDGQSFAVKDDLAHLHRATDTAGHVNDERYLLRSKSRLQPLLTSMAATADSYLRQYMRRIASVSKINQQYRQVMALPEPLLAYYFSGAAAVLLYFARRARRIEKELLKRQGQIDKELLAKLTAGRSDTAAGKAAR
eukprot:gene2658-2957_t